MSEQSLASLLAWLREESRMLGWGMIIALERDKANLVLRHEYIERFSSDDYLRPLSGSVDVAENYWRGVLHNFMFDAPRLLFQTVAAPTPQDPGNQRVQASLTMSLMSGGLVTMENDNTVWRVRRVQAYDTLLDAKLYLHLEMPQTLVIESDGAIKLDFRFSNDFDMELGADSAFNQQVAIALKALFHELEDERRMYSLLIIPEGVDAAWRPAVVELYPQINPNAESNGRGAILALIKLPGGGVGSIPGDNYEYLIPSDGVTSATVLLESMKVLRYLDVGDSIYQRLKVGFHGEEEWEVERDPSGRIVSAANQKGWWVLDIPTRHFWGTDAVGGSRLFSFDLAHIGIWGHSMQGRSQLSLKRDLQHLYSLEWPAENFTTLDAHFGNPDWGAYRRRLEVKNDVNLNCRWLRGGKPHLSFTGTVRVDFTVFPFELVEEPYFHPVPADDLAAIDASSQAALQDHLTMCLHDNFEFKLDQSFSPIDVENQLDDAIRPIFGDSLVVTELQVPFDVVAFGKLNPGRTSLEVGPPDLIIGPAQNHTFTTNAPEGTVHWSASNIDPTSSAVAGTIGPDGTYRAPPLNAIRGNHTRVRVSATQDGKTASALVTVVGQPLAVNPLIATCDADRSGGEGGGTDHIVELFAGLLQKEGARITWAIKNPIEGESGSVRQSADGLSCTFTAHPFLEAKKCVLDEVEVKVEITENGQKVTRTRQALVLASHVGFGLNLFIAEATLNMLRLIAKRNDVDGTVVEPKWSLAEQSPGRIGEDDGIYVPDAARTEPFALIFAKFEGRLKSEGYLIVPLPYPDFPEELILLSQPHELVETNVTPAH